MALDNVFRFSITSPLRDGKVHMSYDPYANLPPAAAFSLTSSDLGEGEKLAMPQVIPVGAGPCQASTARRRGAGGVWAA
jgi:hypothetical protein